MKNNNKKSKLKYILVASFILLIAAGGVFHYLVLQHVAQNSNISVEFGSELDEVSGQESFENLQAAKEQQALRETILPRIEKPEPFEEVELFDDDAKAWNNVFDGYATSGILVFDANNDDLPDVYLSQNGDNWTRPTDENGVLKKKPRSQTNVLYLNQGNDSNGNPIYKQVKDLAAANDTYIKEELLIENLLYPRESLVEVQGMKGRQSATAIAVDLNSDGLKDLVVANAQPGFFWSDPKTQRVLGQFVRPVGREAIKSKLPLESQGLYFLDDYKPNDDINDVQESARGIESMGANSVYLNMGDKDNDGIPEWKDISKETGLEGKRTTLSLMAADFDLDGDIDIFEANVMDPDYWPGGATALAGGANQMYINQLSETGELKFEERSKEMNIDGLYDEDFPMPDYYRLKKYPVIPETYSAAAFQFEKYKPDFLELNGEKSESGQISWCSSMQDVNDDGYMDIWVGNDLGFLRLYMNQEGKRFELADDYARAKQTGYWMSLSAGDFNGDLKEDMFAGNMGGASMNLAMPIPDLFELFNPVITSGTLSQQFFSDKHRSMHAFISGSDNHPEMKTQVLHSSVLPPDAASPNNIRSFGMKSVVKTKYDPNSVDPYEFTWGSTTFDVQNDGKQDVYWVGSLYGRGGGIFPILGTGPGRLLVNATEKEDKTLKFADLTAEHHLFNIHELQYDKLESEGYIYRKSPRQNWNKRSTVNSFDVSVWGFQGLRIQEKVTNHDLLQTSENGRAAVAADLNSDGYPDIIIRNLGGYDSRSSDNKNLKADINGQVQVIPAHDANYPTPTNFEPGSTRTFINQYGDNNWLKIKLLDDTEAALNRDALGAKIIVNHKYLRINRSGGEGFISNSAVPILFGLGEEVATTVTVIWPDKNRTKTTLKLDDYKNGVLTISKKDGVIKWETKTDGIAGNM